MGPDADSNDVYYPEEGQSQEIGRYAKGIFTNAKPSDWIETELAGDSDFGFDYQVQMKVGTQVKHTFRVQLKGTTKPHWVNSQEALSFRLATSALRMYANTSEPTLLVVCVVPDDLPRPFAGETYYVWINEALPKDFFRTPLGRKLPATHALHLPRANRLTHQLDISTHLEARNRFFRQAVDLSSLVVEVTDIDSPDVAMQALGAALSERPEVIPALLDRTEIWPAPPSGTAVSALLDVAEALRNGNWDRAGEIHHRIDAQAMSDPERAEYAYLAGKLLNRKGKGREALIKFDEAARLVQTRDVYLVAAIEMRFVQENERKEEACRTWLSQLSGRTAIEAKVLAARILISLNDESGVDAQLSELPSIERALMRAIWFLFRREFSHANSVCADALLQENLNPRDRAAILTTRARSQWYAAIGPIPDDGELPLSGPAGVDVALLHSVWMDACAALGIFRELGWPQSVEFLTDVAGSTAMMLNRAGELYSLFDEAAQALPWCEGMQKAFEALCVSLGRFKEALVPNLRLPLSPSVIGRRVMLYHQAGKNQDCWEFADANLESLKVETNVAPVAIGMAASAASQCGRPLECQKFLLALGERSNWADYVDFFRVAIDSRRKGQDAAQWGAVLVNVWERHRGSRFIARNVLGVLSSYDGSTAEIILEVVAFLRESQQITFGDTRKIIQAYFTLKRWDAAQAEVNLAIARFGATPQLTAIKAIALDNAGSVAAAFSEYEQGLSSEDVTLELLHAYLGLCFRLSYFDKAIDVLERLLANVKGHDERIECLRLLILIKAETSAPPDEVRALLDEFSLSVSQEDEEEEALYLSLASSLLFVRGIEFSGGSLQDFLTRTNAYSSRFPESRNFKLIQPENGDSPDSLMTSLAPVLGDWRAKAREYLRLERQLKDGKILVPYVMRPGYALHYVPDPLSLWELGKVSGRELRQFHLGMMLGGTIELAFDELGKVPAIDLSALMVLLDLDMLDAIFQLWPKVAISRRTVTYLSQLSSNHFASPRGGEVAKRLLAFIQSNLERIEQPHVELDVNPRRVQPKHLVFECESLIEAGFALYSDDFVVRAMAEESPAPTKSFCTLDVLRWALERGFFDLRQVSGMYALLCKWHVSVRVPNNVFLEPILREPLRFGSLGKVADALERTETFATLARAVWWPERDFGEMSNHIQSVIQLLLERESVSSNLIAAVWSSWLEKLKFGRAQAPVEQNRAAVLFYFAYVLEPSLLKKAWSSFKLTVELEHGDRMETAHEAEAIRFVAKFSKICAAAMSVTGCDQIVPRLQDCVEAGTQEAAWFSQGVMAAIPDIVERDRKRIHAFADGLAELNRPGFCGGSNS
ncbi:DUF4365 domain-containing protein [Paraburkholderia hayleyella]|uniref:DUF4365 domain-containing protein n=1 Tax=Paraburkholderia hayleyella TaxID=2152889 RepID=UPI00129093E8|nr:DUF4365 domain-containing protein [Paraburkholderia hayleyella]